MIESETQTQSPPQGETLAARQAALQIIEMVLSRRQPMDTALEQVNGLSSLPIRDRAFARMLAATTLRRLGQIDDLIIRATDRTEPPSPPLLHHLLRIGTAQLMFMDVPDYAVVDTSVRLADSASLGRQKGFVNAVLRRIAKEGRGQIAKQDEGRLNTPGWIMEQWILDYTLRTAAEIAQANLSEAPLDISIKDPSMAEYWAGTLQASILPTGTLRRASGGLVQDLPGFDDGMWWIQDAAAAIPAKLFGDIDGQDVVDLCAAPGGKTAQLAAAGANVLAIDRSVKRLKRLQDNINRLRLQNHVRTEAADASVWRPKDPVSHILLDAPCSATGTVRRNPDVLHLKARHDLDSLIAVQARLLDQAVASLAPGGTLVYCTCSLQKAEGEAQIARLLDSGAPVRRKPVQASEIGGMETLLTADGDIRVLPFHMAMHGGMDGFYIARLVKDAS